MIPFIDRYFRELPDYWALIALAYLHDIGKPEVDFREGRIHGPSHSAISAQIAQELGVPERLVRVISLNDRAYSNWRKLLDKSGTWKRERWTLERRENFIREFSPEGVDLTLLVRFHRADNAYRRAVMLDESIDPVFWFEQKLLEERLLSELPPEGKDQHLDWRSY